MAILLSKSDPKYTRKESNQAINILMQLKNISPLFCIAKVLWILILCYKTY